MLELRQVKTGFRYNSDSLLLADFIKPKAGAKLLDIGCGCGVVGLLCKQRFKIDLTLLDILPKNASLARINAKHNFLEAKVICSDFLEYKPSFKFDLLVSNPPFFLETSISQDIHKDMAKSARHLPLPRLLSHANTMLGPRGEFCFCYQARLLPFVLSALKSAKFTPTKLSFVHSHPQKQARLVLILAQKSTQKACEILPPVFSTPCFDILCVE